MQDEKKETDLLNDLLKDNENEKNNTENLELVDSEISIEAKKEIESSTQTTNYPSATINNQPQQEVESSNDKTERRGRHNKSCTCEKCEKRKFEKQNFSETKPTESSTTTTDKGGNIFENKKIDFSEFRETKISGNDSTKPQEQNVAKYLTGGILLIVCNAIIPSACVWLFGMFDARFKKIKLENIKLDSEQIKDLTPLADAAIKEMVITMSATSAFFLTMFILFGANIMGEAANFKELPVDEKVKKK